MNLNKVIIIGNLTRDPEARVTPENGTPISNFGVATNRVWTDSQGQRQQQTEFHNIVAFGRLAEICNQFLRKGRLVCIEGRLQTRSWLDQNGIKRFRTEIIAEGMQMGPQSIGPVSPEPFREENQTEPSPESSPELTPENLQENSPKDADEEVIDLNKVPF
jgi:single-strand DNA-binding protein